MEPFDTLHVERPALAIGYLALLKGQPGRPIALFAPRRIGKTYFLKNDLMPAAVQAGFLPVYADLWLSRGEPIAAINYALEEALDDVLIPTGAVGKIAKTLVKKIAGVEFGNEPKHRPLPEKPEQRFDALITRIAAASGKTILLMLDEIQSLAESNNGTSAISAIRAVLSNRQSIVHAVFTGSSQDALSQMMSTVGAPMYQFAQLLDFPYLDDQYLQLLANRFQKVHPGKALDLAQLRQAFAYIGYKPALMKDIVKEMSVEGVADVNFALRIFMQDERQVAGWQAGFEAQPALEQALLVALAHGLPPMAKATIAQLTKSSGEPVTISKVRYALEKLHRSGVLTKAQGSYKVADQLFSDYIVRTHVPKVVPSEKSKKLPQ